MSMSEGLSYLAIRPVRDDEWDNLPHTYLTKDTPWDPSQFDHAITPQWYDSLPGKPQMGDLPHDLEGNPTPVEGTGANQDFSDDDVDETTLHVNVQRAHLSVNRAAICTYLTAQISDDLVTSDSDVSDESVFHFQDSDSDTLHWTNPTG